MKAREDLDDNVWPVRNTGNHELSCLTESGETVLIPQGAVALVELTPAGKIKSVKITGKWPEPEYLP